MTAPDYTELRHCPFCGARPHRGLGKVQHDQMHGDPYQRAWVRCPSGHASFDCMNEEMAIAAWNQRADDTAIAELQSKVRTQALEYLALDGQATELQAQVEAMREAMEVLVAAADEPQEMPVGPVNAGDMARQATLKLGLALLKQLPTIRAALQPKDQSNG